MKFALSFTTAALLFASVQANPLFRRFDNSTQINNGTKPTTNVLSGTCFPGAFGCNSASTFSQCVPTSGTTTTYIYMGSVPAGMICKDGQIVRDDLGNCSPAGSLACLNGGKTFGLCAPDGLIYMGIVAAGTLCQNGTIGFAPGYGGN